MFTNIFISAPSSISKSLTCVRTVSYTYKFMFFNCSVSACIVALWKCFTLILFLRREGLIPFNTPDPVIKISLDLFSFSGLGLDWFDLIGDDVTFVLLLDVRLITFASFVTFLPLCWLLLFGSDTVGGYFLCLGCFCLDHQMRIYRTHHVEGRIRLKFSRTKRRLAGQI